MPADVQSEGQSLGADLREDSPSVSLYIYYLHRGVTHSHLPALLTKGRGEMAMDNSLRHAVKYKIFFKA